MSFFEMPAWEPPSGYRIPPWLRPPETMIPGIVPVELLLGRNYPGRWPRTFETEQPDPPFLFCHGGGGSEHGWRSPHWLWGLPPPGPLAFVCTWPTGQLPAAGVEIDSSLVLEAASRAVPAWPAG
jgi:hypothetical protein